MLALSTGGPLESYWMGRFTVHPGIEAVIILPVSPEDFSESLVHGKIVPQWSCIDSDDGSRGNGVAVLWQEKLENLLKEQFVPRTLVFK